MLARLVHRRNEPEDQHHVGMLRWKRRRPDAIEDPQDAELARAIDGRSVGD